MDELIFFGSEVKAQENGVVDGYLVRFGEPDASKKRDVFTKADTDFDIDPARDVSTVYYNHGLDGVLKKRTLGTEKAQIGIDNVGVWIKSQLDLRDKYEAAIYQLAKAGKLGWSSGAPGHLVERKAIGDDAHLVTKWPLGKDASLTPLPADPKNLSSVKSIGDVDTMSLEDAIKSLLKDNPLESDSDGENGAESEAQINPEAEQSAGSATDAKDKPTADVKSNLQVIGDRMADENTQQTPAPQNPIDADFMKRFDAMNDRLNKIVDVMEKSPRISRSGYYTNDGGGADPNIKSLGDLVMAVKRRDTERLEKVYEVKAQTESSGPAGAYLIPQQTLTNLDTPLELKSGIGNLVRRIPVSAPAGEAPIRDYSRVPTASAGNSASAQGIESQKRAEAGSFGAENIYFEMLNWRVTDFASGSLKASREIMEDAPMIEAMLREAIQEDVANKEEYGILRGNGVGQPLGVLNWAGTAEVTEATDNTFSTADMDNMVSKLLRGNGSRVAWVYHNYVYPQIAKLERGTGGAVLHNIKDALPAFLSGYPQFMSQHLPAIGTNGYNVLGDWSKYFLFELGGLYVNFSEHRYADTGEVAWFFGKRIDGKPAMTSAVTLADGASTLSPFVKILNRS